MSITTHPQNGPVSVAPAVPITVPISSIPPSSVDPIQTEMNVFPSTSNNRVGYLNEMYVPYYPPHGKYTPQTQALGTVSNEPVSTL